MAENIESSVHEEVKELLDKYPGIFNILTEQNKVICKLTKHELPLNVKPLQSYINGKKFQSLLKKVKNPEVVLKIEDKYKDYFIPSRKSSSRLYCTLTKKEISKLPHEIEQYITGYKFLKAIDSYRKRKAKEEEAIELGDEDGRSKNADIEMEETEEGGEEGEVPFFALSSDEDENNDEDETGSIEKDTNADDKETTEKMIGNIIEPDVGNDASIVRCALDINGDKEGDTTADTEKKNKKRKGKHAKLKKDRKAKKLKPGAK